MEEQADRLGVANISLISIIQDHTEAPWYAARPRLHGSFLRCMLGNLLKEVEIIGNTAIVRRRQLQATATSSKVDPKMATNDALPKDTEIQPSEWPSASPSATGVQVEEIQRADTPVTQRKPEEPPNKSFGASREWEGCSVMERLFMDGT